MVKQWQISSISAAIANGDEEPQLAMMAEAFGIKGLKCADKKDVPKIVGQMHRTRRPGGG